MSTKTPFDSVNQPPWRSAHEAAFLPPLAPDYRG